jgi:hypothetical protein
MVPAEKSEFPYIGDLFFWIICSFFEWMKHSTIAIDAPITGFAFHNPPTAQMSL